MLIQLGKRFAIGALFMLAPFGYASGCTTQSGVHHAAVTKVTVCDLYKSPEALNGRRLYLAGVYTTDRLENTTITDSKCPDVWVIPYYASDAMGSSNLRRFSDAVAGNLSDSSLRVFSVVLFGKFVWRPGKQPHGAFYIFKVVHFDRLRNINPWKRE